MLFNNRRLSAHDRLPGTTSTWGIRRMLNMVVQKRRSDGSGEAYIAWYVESPTETENAAGGHVQHPATGGGTSVTRTSSPTFAAT